MECRAQARFHDAESETDNDHQHPDCDKFCSDETSIFF
jgi:hypothetical protein